MGPQEGILRQAPRDEARRLVRSALFRRVWSTMPVQGVLSSWAQSAHHQAPRGEWKFFVGKDASAPESRPVSPDRNISEACRATAGRDGQSHLYKVACFAKRRRTCLLTPSSSIASVFRCCNVTLSTVRFS